MTQPADPKPKPSLNVIDGGGGDQRKPVIKPVVRDTVDLGTAVDEACAVLAFVPNLYQRDGRLVHIVRVSKDEATAKLLEGTPTIRLLTLDGVREMLCRYGSVIRGVDQKGQPIPCKPCSDLVRALMDRGQWRTVRPITGIVEAPMLLPDGSVMQQPGYDSQTGYVYEPTIEFPEIPDAPTVEQVKASAELLRDVWADFPWRSEADASVPVALLLTMLCRPAVGDVPAFALEATTPGSGKGLAIDAASVIATGRRANKQTYAFDPVEQEKILGAMALRGAAHVAFDDIKDPFGGSPICKVLTCGGANTFRILGKSEAPDLPWRAIITVTGNNIQLSGDVPRRLVMARLEPETERPELRTDFRHPRLLDYCEEQRASLVAAALTLVRAWWRAGKPAMDLPTLGSFEAWAALVPAVCVWAGLGNPLDCCPSNQDIEDPEVVALRCVLEQWPTVAPNGETIGTIIKRLWPDDMHGQTTSLDGYDDLRAALTVLGPPRRDGGVPTSDKIGRALKRMTGRIVGGRKLMSRAGHGGILVWHAVNVGVKPKQKNNNQAANNGEESFIMVGMEGTGGDSPVLPTRATLSTSDGVGKSQPRPPSQPPSTLEFSDDEPGLFDDLVARCARCGAAIADGWLCADCQDDSA